MKNNFSIRDKKEKLIYKKGQGMRETLNAHTHTHTHACAHTHTHTTNQQATIRSHLRKTQHW